MLFYFPRERALDNNGRPGDGWKLNFYKAGTSTRKDTYTDEDLTTPHANPVESDAAGEFPAIYLSGSYKVVLTDENDVEKWTVDDYSIDGGSVSQDNIKALTDLSTDNLTDGEIVFVRAFYANTDNGGGPVYFDEDRPKSDANGGTIIDPDNVGTLSDTDLGTFLSQQGTGSGTGCWVRIYDGSLLASWFGIHPNNADTVNGPAIVDMLYNLKPEGGRIEFEYTGTTYKSDRQIVPPAAPIHLHFPQPSHVRPDNATGLEFTQTDGTHGIFYDRLNSNDNDGDSYANEDLFTWGTLVIRGPGVDSGFGDGVHITQMGSNYNNGELIASQLDGYGTYWEGCFIGDPGKFYIVDTGKCGFRLNTCNWLHVSGGVVKRVGQDSAASLDDRSGYRLDGSGNTIEMTVESLESTRAQRPWIVESGTNNKTLGHWERVGAGPWLKSQARGTVLQAYGGFRHPPKVDDPTAIVLNGEASRTVLQVPRGQTGSTGIQNLFANSDFQEGGSQIFNNGAIVTTGGVSLGSCWEWTVSAGTTGESSFGNLFGQALSEDDLIVAKFDIKANRVVSGPRSASGSSDHTKTEAISVRPIGETESGGLTDLNQSGSLHVTTEWQTHVVATRALADDTDFRLQVEASAVGELDDGTTTATDLTISIDRIMVVVNPEIDPYHLDHIPTPRTAAGSAIQNAVPMAAALMPRPLEAAPSATQANMVVWADGSTWDPLSKGGSEPYLVMRNSGDTAWIPPGTTAQTYTPSNVTTTRSFDADNTTVAEMADVLGTLLGDMGNT